MTLRSEDLDTAHTIDSKSFSLTVKPFRQCLFLLDELLSHYECVEFIEPVPEDASIYHKEIKNPMDLSTIEQKLFNNKYTAYQHFRQDLELIWTNATTFHRDFDEIYKEALMLKQRLIALETFLFENKPVPSFISSTTHNIESTVSEQTLDEKIGYLHFPLYPSIFLHRKSNLYFIRTIPEGSDPSREYKGFNNVITMFNQLNFPFTRYLDNTIPTLPLPRFYIAKDRELLVKAIHDPEGVIAVFLDVKIEPIYGNIENVLSFKARVAIVEPIGEIHKFDKRSLPRTGKFENPPSVWMRFRVIRVEEVESVVSIEMNRAILRGFYEIIRISTNQEELKKVANPEFYTNFARDIIKVSLNGSKKTKQHSKALSLSVTAGVDAISSSVNKQEEETNSKTNVEHLGKNACCQENTNDQISATLCGLKNSDTTKSDDLPVMESLLETSNLQTGIIPPSPNPGLYSDGTHSQPYYSSFQPLQDTTQNVHTTFASNTSTKNTSQSKLNNNGNQKQNMYIAPEVHDPELIKKPLHPTSQNFASNKIHNILIHEVFPDQKTHYTNQVLKENTSQLTKAEQLLYANIQPPLNREHDKKVTNHPFFDPKTYYKSIKTQANKKPQTERKKNAIWPKPRPSMQQTMLDQGYLMLQSTRQKEMEKKTPEPIEKQTEPQTQAQTELQVQAQQSEKIQLKIQHLQIQQQIQDSKYRKIAVKPSICPREVELSVKSGVCRTKSKIAVKPRPYHGGDEVVAKQIVYHGEGRIGRNEDTAAEILTLTPSLVDKKPSDCLIQTSNILSNEPNPPGALVALEKQICTNEETTERLLKGTSEKNLFAKRLLSPTQKQTELYAERSKYLFCELLEFSKRIHVPVKQIESYCFDIKASPNAEGYFKQVYFLQDSKDKVVQTFRRMTTAQRVTEIASLLKLKNMPHIGQIVEVIEEQGEIIGLSMQRYQKTLKQYAHPHSHHRLTAYQKMNVVVQLLECMKAIHDHGLAHRDLSEVNFMVNETDDRLPDGSRKAEVYLIDFGKSNFVFPEDVNRWWIQLPPGETDCSDIVPTTEEELKEWCEQLPWMRAKPDHGYRLYRSIQTMPKSRVDAQELPWLIDPLAEDVYSIGTIIWKIFTETEPWYGILETDIRSLREIVGDDYNIEKALEREVPGAMSRQLLLHALKVVPQERKSADEILSWIKNPETQTRLIQEWQAYAPVDRQKRHAKRFSDETVNSMPVKRQKTGRMNRSKASTVSPS
ncbi:hypothetical protein BY458DRAFT_217232 [Sporodiniella umbellata]|nr:hypothetical protein BY458DRAFT_217232 [Sporodiniella umbellata]